MDKISLRRAIESFGGQGSGNFGHSGRPGDVGGSGEGGNQGWREILQSRIEDYEIHRISISGGWKSEHLDALQKAGYKVYLSPVNPIGLKYAEGIAPKRTVSDAPDFIPILHGATIKEVKSIPAASKPRKGNPEIGLADIYKQLKQE